MSDEMKVSLAKDSTVDKMRVRQGEDGYSYPYTSPDLVVDKTGKSTTTKFTELENKIEKVGSTSIDDTNTATDKTWSSSKIDTQFKDIANLKNTGLTLTQIDLLKDVLYKMEFSTEELATQGKQAIDKLISSLKNTQSEDKVLISIYAVYNGGDVLVGTDINSLDISVTANYSDNTTANITDFEVSGEITEGENIITITYNEKITTVTVKGYVEGLVDIKGDALLEGYYIAKNKDYSFYQLTSEGGRRNYSIPIKANTKYTIAWDLDNQYRNPNIGASNFTTTVADISSNVWLLCTTSDMKDATTERTTATFENPITLNKLYELQEEARKGGGK